MSENQGKPLDYAKVLQIQRLLMSGYSMRKVAEIVGVAFNTVAKYREEEKEDQAIPANR